MIQVVSLAQEELYLVQRMVEALERIAKSLEELNRIQAAEG